MNKTIEEVCCTPIGQIKRYVDCKGCDRKPKQDEFYSEEDVKTAFLDGWQLRDGDLPFPKAYKKWFEQFKKK